MTATLPFGNKKAVGWNMRVHVPAHGLFMERGFAANKQY